jgi:hypothetical protein
MPSTVNLLSTNARRKNTIFDMANSNQRQQTSISQCYMSIFKTDDIVLNSHCVKFAVHIMMCMAGAIDSPIY